MKRTKLIKHLTKNGYHLLRKGGKHSIFYNPVTNKVSPVPRHIEIKQFIAEKYVNILTIGIAILKTK